MIIHIKRKIIPLLVMVGLLLWSAGATAQKITLDSAVNIALRNNLSIKSEKLKADYQQALIKTSAALPATNFSGEFGQFNSIFFDHRFGVSQGLSLPSVYGRQKTLLVEEWKVAALGVATKAAELKKAVAETFYALLFLRKKEQILLRTDSMYNVFLKQSTQRLKSGESNILEQTTAAAQSGHQKLLLQQLLQEKLVLNVQLQLLLNAEGNFEPTAPGLDTAWLNLNRDKVDDHPYLQVLRQQKAVSAANSKVEQSRLLPELNLGYFNTSIRGVGADDITYSGAKRFQSFQVGVGVPLFRSAQRAKITAAKLQERVTESAYEAQKKQLDQQLQAALIQVRSYSEQVNYYQQTLLPNYEVMLQTANGQLKGGEINYLDWVQLMHQRTVGELSYLELLKAYHEAQILVNYLTNQ